MMMAASKHETLGLALEIGRKAHRSAPLCQRALPVGLPDRRPAIT